MGGGGCIYKSDMNAIHICVWVCVSVYMIFRFEERYLYTVPNVCYTRNVHSCNTLPLITIKSRSKCTR
jgi:hypothetical protein